MIVHTHNTHLQNVQTAIEIVHMYNMRCLFTLLTICTQHDGGSFTPREAPATWKCIGPGFSGCACRLWGRPARQATSASDGERVYLRLRKKKQKNTRWMYRNVHSREQTHTTLTVCRCSGLLRFASLLHVIACMYVSVHAIACCVAKQKQKNSGEMAMWRRAIDILLANAIACWTVLLSGAHEPRPSRTHRTHIDVCVCVVRLCTDGTGQCMQCTLHLYICLVSYRSTVQRPSAFRCILHCMYMLVTAAGHATHFIAVSSVHTIRFYLLVLLLLLFVFIVDYYSIALRCARINDRTNK